MEDKERDEKFKSNLTALFFQFKDKPHLLANYLYQHDALKEIFKDRIIENDKLSSIYDDMKNNKDDKPYFTNLTDMQQYYNQFFLSNKTNETVRIHPILGASTSEEALKNQLEEALNKEDYERAANIRDYMIQLGYKI